MSNGIDLNRIHLEARQMRADFLRSLFVRAVAAARAHFARRLFDEGTLAGR